jgi:hypothetical protein
MSLLAGIAALPEVDAADQLEVDHLRHELFHRGGLDERHAAADFQPAPAVEIEGGQGGRCRAHQQRAWCTLGVRKSNDDALGRVAPAPDAGPGQP